MAAGLSEYSASLFHLVNHAFFKALLFLSAGSILHATMDQQDQRKLGGLLGFLPFTYTAILIGSLSLMAMPWITGFYSKDLILELAFAQFTFNSQVAYWLGTISATLTAFYSYRLVSLTFITYPNANQKTYNAIHDAPIIVMIPLTILSVLAIFFGYMARDLFVGIGTDFLSDSLFIYPNHVSLVEAEFGLTTFIKLLPLIGTVLGITVCLYLYHIMPLYLINLTKTTIGKRFYSFFNGKYFIDVIYNYYIINGSLQLGYIISKVVDRGFIELVGPHGVSLSMTYSSHNLTKFDTGNLTSYALYIAISMVSLILVVYSPILFDHLFIDPRLILLILGSVILLPILNSKLLHSPFILYYY